MTSHAWPIVRAIISCALVIAGVGSLVVYTVKNAEDPPRMILKWCVTLGTGLLFVFVALPSVAQEGYAALHGLSVTLICAIIMVITWRRDLAGLVANPIASLYDGGTEPPDPHPAYSVAMARQKQGHYLEAIAEIRKQLDRFPTDVEGQLLLAQVQAEDLKDMAAAEITIQHFCEQPGHATPEHCLRSLLPRRLAPEGCPGPRGGPAGPREDHGAIPGFGVRTWGGAPYRSPGQPGHAAFPV